MKISNTITARKKKILKAMLDQGIMQGGTKFIYFEITKNENGYEAKCFEKYALASRQFDCRPESKIVKWHFEDTYQIFI